MKITSVECYLGTYELGGFCTVKVNTDEGIYGWGEAGLAYGKVAAALNKRGILSPRWHWQLH